MNWLCLHGCGFKVKVASKLNIAMVGDIHVSAWKSNGVNGGDYFFLRFLRFFLLYCVFACISIAIMASLCQQQFVIVVWHCGKIAAGEAVNGR